MKTIRLFVSSPGDVGVERNIVRNVISDLNSIYGKYAKLELLMWEDFPLSANSTFQEGINYFITNKPIDIAIFILWSRLGTPLCTKFVKDDGSAYNSGTEYEFDLMMRLHESSGRPSRILTYVKQDDKYPDNYTWQELKETLRQKEQLELFLKEYFRDDETNSNYAYMPFGINASFEQIFRTHIVNAIRDIIGEIDEIKEWEGNPYVGLNSFEFEQNSIFFGRRQLIYETASKLNLFAGENNHNKSLIVFGESGSGKSSFIKAGLLPFFCNRNQSNCKYVCVSPSMYGGKMYQGLLDLLVKEIDSLVGHPFIEELRKGITRDSNFKYLAHALEKDEGQDLIIYIDQFEELFTDSLISEQEREDVILLIRGLVNMSRISVFISMRSDFYGRFLASEILAQIKENCVVVDIPLMGPSEIAEIVEAPASKACLKWELNDKGVALNHHIVQDAVTIKDLPLIEFALSELYEARNEHDVLTYRAYELMGGLKGAIVNYADKCYDSLTAQEKKAFDDLLCFVIAESSLNKGLYVRKTSLREDAEKSDLHKQVLDKMLSARLFVSGKDSEGNATISITHEVLLKSWKVVEDWIEREKTFISSSAHYEQLSQHWYKHGRQTKDLIHGRSPLLEAEYYHFKNKGRITKDVLNYLNQSLKEDRRSGLAWRIIVLGTYIFCIIAIALAKISGLEFDIDILDSYSPIDLFLLYGAVFIILLNGVILRLEAKPKYMTAARSLIAWSSAAVFLALYSFTGQVDLSSALFTAIFPFLPVLIYLPVEFSAFNKRKRWHSEGYKPYKISDVFWAQFKTIGLTTMVVFFVFALALNYYVDLQEKNDAMERRAEVTDILFDGLNNIQNTLSYQDNKAVNEIRKQYLEENFLEELQDTICDHRELEYARTLYNLKEPSAALAYLYPDHDWGHHLMWVLCKYASAEYDDAEFALEEYVKGNRIAQLDNNTSSANLIWISELLGRFDIAEQLDKMALDSIPGHNTNPGALINRAHISLYKGDLEDAVVVYKQALKEAEAMAYVDQRTGRNLLYNNIENDLHLFSRSDIIPEYVLRDVAGRLNASFVPAFVPLSEALGPEERESIFLKLAGDWHCQDRQISINLNVDPERELMAYLVFNQNQEEQAKMLLECRFGRDGEYLLMDEFEPMSDYNSFGKIIAMEDDYFDVQIIEDGNIYDRGVVRRFTRIEEQEGE